MLVSRWICRLSVCGSATLSLIGCGSSSSPSPNTAASAGNAGAAGSTSGISGSTSGISGSNGVAGADNTIPTPQSVGKCDKLAPVGTWEKITPPAVSLDAGFVTKAGGNYGTGVFVLDPANSGTVYLGTSAQGIYKTTDCGSTWTHINTGANGAILDAGRQWTMQIDPVDTQVLYTNTGYGMSGIWKSTNGGVDWQQVLPPDIAKAFIFGGFVARIQIDPTNHRHLLAAPHFSCENGHSPSCILETLDAGDSWRVVENAPMAGEGAGLSMVNSNIWLWQNPEGIFRTADAGKSWSQVFKGFTSDGFYSAKNGSIYVGAIPLISSSDKGASWDPVTNAPHAVSLIGDGTTLYTSWSVCTGSEADPFMPYSSAQEAAPTTWTTISSPGMHTGGRYIDIDPPHHLLYSSNCLEGFWRSVVK